MKGTVVLTTINWGFAAKGIIVPCVVVRAQLVRDIMDMAVADGLTLLRTFAFATNPLYPMQTAPGIYNEAILRGLDYVLDQARQRGIKARSL